ncbi:PulJ/GspJ family protein [Alkalihalobacillus pseudalcaliphilus]|uniref:PulJ/GspJ family protein n=1 Tax=Alkalihalobacillus pseudalcaliphilus TaxID=79884 RepID=UPI00064D93D3|nr:prepilin-type N-terminal cleavage/methylation domain-containing protein [Alkalihalobacillus pseudalcaliphilus]KMK74653.1 hypothetical protein AB990_19345 [Alkalihalobacillus pseudalcaliphilus]
MKRLINNQRGVTLIELLAALTLISLVFGGITYVAIQQNQAQQTFQQASIDRTILQATVAEMKRHIENAKELKEKGNNKIELTTAEGDIITYEITDGTLIENRELDGKRELLHNAELLETNGSIVDLKLQGEEKPIQMSQRKMVVVMARGEEETNEPSIPKHDFLIICRKGQPFTYPEESDFAKFKNQMDCDKENSTLSTKWHEQFHFSDGTYKIDTENFNVSHNLRISKGSLITTGSLITRTSRNVEINNGGIYLLGDFDSTGGTNRFKTNEIIADNLFLSSDPILDIKNDIKINYEIHVKGNVSLSAENITGDYLTLTNGSIVNIIGNTSLNNGISITGNAKLNTHNLSGQNLLINGSSGVNSSEIANLVDIENKIEINGGAFLNTKILSTDTIKLTGSSRAIINQEFKANKVTLTGTSRIIVNGKEWAQ